jgi:hypothetical protein
VVFIKEINRGLLLPAVIVTAFIGYGWIGREVQQSNTIDFVIWIYSVSTYKYFLLIKYESSVGTGIIFEKVFS